MVKIKADENIPKSTIVFLKEYGFEVKSVSDEDLLGHGDEDISHFAKGEGRIIITLDKDFGSYLKFPTMASCGVILLRLKHAHPAYVNARLREFLVR
jgi:predicted nuclease of predicted toxin-antitoxin system